MTITRVAVVDTAQNALRPAVRVRDTGALRRAHPGATPGSSCNDCRFRDTCIGEALRGERRVMRPLVGYRRHLQTGEVLYQAGAKCSLVHVLQSGFFKTIMLSDDGVEQITGFQMAGDMLGVDSLSCGVHATAAIALTPATVCVISRGRLLQLSVENDALCRRLLGVLSDEIGGDRATMLLLGSRPAEQRVAGFIVELSERLSARGYCGTQMELWMSREDIGRYLGLELETVSRVMSSLVRRHLINVRRRRIEIPDLRALRYAVGGGHDAQRHTRHARLAPALEVTA